MEKSYNNKIKLIATDVEGYSAITMEYSSISICYTIIHSHKV